MLKENIKKQSGFTLIEIMIATALFVVIMIIGIGVLLNVTKTHKTTQIMRSAMDSMSFVMEDITRNTRLGSMFYCGDYSGITVGTLSCPAYGTLPDSSGLPASLEIAFEGLYGDPVEPEDQIIYKFIQDSIGSSTGYLAKHISGDPTVSSTFKRITPVGVKLDLTKSGFTVVGSDSDNLQTKVIVRLFGTVNYQNVTVPFNFQTTISPRNIDS